MKYKLNKVYDIFISGVLILCMCFAGCGKNSSYRGVIESTITLNKYVNEAVIDIYYDDQFLYGITGNQLICFRIQHGRDAISDVDVHIYPIYGTSICAYSKSIFVFSEDGYISKYNRDTMKIEEEYEVKAISGLHMYNMDETRMSACHDKILISRGYYDASISSDLMRYFVYDIHNKKLHEISDLVHGYDEYSFLISMSWVDDERISLISVATNDSIEPKFKAYIYDLKKEIIEEEILLDFWASDCVYDALKSCYVYSSDGFSYYCYDPDERSVTSLFSLFETEDIMQDKKTQIIGKLISVSGVVIVFLPQKNIIQLCRY